MQILRSPGHYTQAELQALEWLGQRAKWLTVRVKRRDLGSDREFDLFIEGEYDADDGYEYAKVQSFGDKPEDYRRMRRLKPKVKPQRFSAWFPLAALYQFWSMGLHKPAHDEWSCTRDMLDTAQWAEFHRIVDLARSKPLFSANFLECVQAVWYSISEDGQFAENEDAIEACLDADRLGMLGTENGRRANEELRWLDEFHTPQKVVAELGTKLALVVEGATPPA